MAGLWRGGNGTGMPLFRFFFSSEKKYSSFFHALSLSQLIQVSKHKTVHSIKPDEEFFFLSEIYVLMLYQ